MPQIQPEAFAEEQAQTSKETHYPLFCSVRLTYTICAFLAMIMHLCMRNIFNFTILCMVQQEDVVNVTVTGNNESTKYVYSIVNNTDSRENSGDIPWTRQEEFAIQATFYYGYLVTLPFAGRLADRFGGKFFFIHSVTMQAALFMLIPTFAHFSYLGTSAIRLLQGLVAGFGNPALYQLFSTWAHRTERSTLLSFAYGGYSVGTLIAFPLSALLCRYNWELVFYIVGSVALVFGISCHWLVYNTLEEHPRLSEAERAYLKSTNDEKSKSKSIPWSHILSSAPVYAFILTHVLHSYGIIVFTMMLPRFLKEALDYSLSEAGIYASTPFLGGIIAKIIIFPACRYIEKKPSYKPTLYGKIFYVLCNIFTIKFLIVVMLLNATQRMFINLCILFVGIFSDMAFSGGYWPSLLHLTPSYAGLLSGIANAFSTIDGFISPIIISAIAVQGTKSEWNYVMLTLLISYLLAAIVFGTLGSSKLRSWNNLSANDSV
ncbi:sialin [Zeugodacus cucurbitae]|uniref:sialin n=1 Tax=Zeugodacus cucurbitae TaxID=28588 RepID=UPI000596A06B|nr:sialin [Zeugodacus cucurbitae]